MKEQTLLVYNELFERYPALNDCKQTILKAFNLLYDTYKKGGKVLCCGNGGSASDSEHIVGELLKSFKQKRDICPTVAKNLLRYDDGELLASKLEGALPAISLSSQSAFITAFANDNSWDLVFAQQVYGLGKEGDCLICLSTSGNSKNCVLASQVARAKNMSVISLTGNGGGRLADYSDATITVNETQTYKVQELHLPVYHCLCAMLECEFFN